MTGTTTIEVFRNAEAVGRAAAQRIARHLIVQLDATLALPTGETPKPAYEHLARFYQHGLIDTSQTYIFLLDDFEDLPPGHSQSFRAYIEEQVISPMNVPQKHFQHFPAAGDHDPDQVCAAYESSIAQRGGLDLVVLGIGTNGHLAYNEPGTSLDRLTHRTELTSETRDQLRNQFSPEEPPRHAWTMGLKTILHGKEILLLAEGQRKAAIVKKALTGSISDEIPASILQLHPNCQFLLDHEAAQELPSDII